MFFNTLNIEIDLMFYQQGSYERRDYGGDKVIFHNCKLLKCTFLR